MHDRAVVEAKPLVRRAETPRAAGGCAGGEDEMARRVESESAYSAHRGRRHHPPIIRQSAGSGLVSGSSFAAFSAVTVLFKVWCSLNPIGVVLIMVWSHPG
jgi:hypothetical protein